MGYISREWTLSLGGMAWGVGSALLDPTPAWLSFQGLVRTMAVIILAQGLLRDLVLMSLRRRNLIVSTCSSLGGLRFCMASTLGSSLLILYFTLFFLSLDDSWLLPKWFFGTFAGGVWWLGYQLRNWVVIFHRAPLSVDRVLMEESYPAEKSYHGHDAA